MMAGRAVPAAIAWMFGPTPLARPDALPCCAPGGDSAHRGWRTRRFADAAFSPWPAGSLGPLTPRTPRPVRRPVTRAPTCQSPGPRESPRRGTDPFPRSRFQRGGHQRGHRYGRRPEGLLLARCRPAAAGHCLDGFPLYRGPSRALLDRAPAWSRRPTAIQSDIFVSPTAARIIHADQRIDAEIPSRHPRSCPEIRNSARPRMDEPSLKFAHK